MANADTARAIVVDPRPLFRATMHAWLTNNGYGSVAQFGNLDEVKQHIDSFQPELIIIGPHLAETSLPVCRELMDRHPTLKIILFTARADDLLFQADAVYAGVAACVSSEITDEELPAVIAQVLAGQRLFSQEILALAFQPIELTERERDVLRSMAEGKSDREIADTLGLKFRVYP